MSVPGNILVAQTPASQHVLDGVATASCCQRTPPDHRCLHVCGRRLGVRHVAGRGVHYQALLHLHVHACNGSCTTSTVALFLFIPCFAQCGSSNPIPSPSSQHAAGPARALLRLLPGSDVAPDRLHLLGAQPCNRGDRREPK